MGTCSAQPIKSHVALEGPSPSLSAPYRKLVHFKGEILALKWKRGFCCGFPSYQLNFLSSGCFNLSHNHVNIANKWQLQSP